MTKNTGIVEGLMVKNCFYIIDLRKAEGGLNPYIPQAI